MDAMDAQWKRIEAIVGVDEPVTFEKKMTAFYECLLKSLKLPCEVTGIEDFQWEERYVFGPGNQAEYKRLKKECPSYKDRYELLAIEKDAVSEWMMAAREDIGAIVKRKHDGKEFCLGLSELEAVDKKSTSAQLLDDFSVFFFNSR